MTRVVGIVPAAGTGSRLWPYRAAKELVQVGYAQTRDADGRLRTVPMTAVEHVLGAMRRADVDSVFLVLSPAKGEILRYLGCGGHLGLRLAYLCQEEPRGVPHAVDLARSFVGDATVLFGMPDTVVEPLDSHAQLLKAHEERDADVTLGVFATDQAAALAPVVFDQDTGRVLDIVDKPAVPPVANTWGIAAWSPAFTELLGEFVQAATRTATELLLTEAFMTAVRAGLRVFALPFDTGAYHDLGSPTNLITARIRLEAHIHRDIP